MDSEDGEIISRTISAPSARDWRITSPRTYGAASWGIIHPMTRHKHAHIGLVTPSPLDHWIDATLRAFAMLVLNVASTLQMTRRRTRVNATRATPADLPRETTDTQAKETTPAVQHDSSPKALILRDRLHDVRSAELPRAIVSKDERVLTNAGQAMARHREPHTKASPSLRSSRRKSGPRAPSVMLATGLRQQPWIPTCVGMSGTRPATPAPTN
jgi:hypothetical protein